MAIGSAFLLMGASSAWGEEASVKAADYELGMGLVYTTGQTDWNHDATSASALLGNPTSELTYEELDTLALEFNGRVSLRRLGSGFSKYFVRGMSALTSIAAMAISKTMTG